MAMVCCRQTIGKPLSIRNTQTIEVKGSDRCNSVEKFTLNLVILWNSI